MTQRIKTLYRNLKRKGMSKQPTLQWPPQLLEAQASILLSEVKDWQINHGSLLKLVRTEEDHTILARLIGASLFPTPFPEPCFEEARRIQILFNELYAALACDEEWLEETLKDLIVHDRFVSTLWNIHRQVKEEGYVQDLTLGLFRSDYMLSKVSNRGEKDHPCLKQVELNGIACAGGVHSNRVSNMHQHLAKTGIYTTDKEEQFQIDSSHLRDCHTTSALVSGLAAAHEAYGPIVTNAKQKGIIMVVQPYNVNVCDERPIEYGLWSQDPPVPLYRVTWGPEVMALTEISTSRALLFHAPNGLVVEVSVVYLRAGLDEDEYNDIGVATRTQLEKSRAIKCPSVLSHMTTFKKVQQALANLGVVQGFVPAIESERITDTFARMYPLDESEQGQRGRELALKPSAADDYVLKPSLEGGGHNVYGTAIPDFLSGIPKSDWGNYILMKKIVPPVIHNVLISPRDLYQGSVRSELGIFGQCIWRHRRQERSARTKYEMLLNEQDGFSFKTKAEEINEMSVVKGYGCFDSPLLVSLDVFQCLCRT